MNKTNPFLNALALLSITAGLANGLNINVIVTDPHDAPVPAATVTLVSRGNGGSRTLTTDPSGTGRFSGVAPGAYFIHAEAPGFDRSEARLLELNKDAHTEVTLPLGLALVRNSVVVTASGTPQTTDELSKALTVVEGQVIDVRAEKSLADALREVPGLRIQQLGGPGAFTTFKVRGLRNSDTAVLIDGLRLRDAAGTQADASGVLQDIIMTNTNRVEVLRGAGSSLYGTNAIGGVVNIVTDDGGGRTRGSLLAEGGSLDMVRGRAQIAGGFGADRVQYSAGAAHLNVMSGVNEDSPARNTSGQGQITYRMSRAALLSGRIYTADSLSRVRTTGQRLGTLPPTGIIEAIPLRLSEQRRYEAGTPVSQLNIGSATFLPATNNPDSTRAGRFFTGALRLSLRPSDSFGFTAQYHGLSTTRNFGDGPGGPGRQPAGTSLSSFDGRIHTANARVNWLVGRAQQFDAGYEWESETYMSRSIPPPPASRFSTDVIQHSNTLYVQDQVRLAGGRFQIAGAYRMQFFSLGKPVFDPIRTIPFTDRTFDAPPTAQTGDVSTAYTFRRTGTKLRAHVGRGYRAPSLFERFGTFFDGASYILYGDPGLRPDRSIAFDGGVDQMFWNSRAQLSATYFYTRLNEVIVFDTSGAVNPIIDPLGRSGGYRNTGGGLTRGVEVSSSVAATRSLHLTGAYTYTDARQQTPLVAGVWRSYAIPRHQSSVSLTQRFSPRLTAFFVYLGSTDFLASLSGRAFRFPGVARGELGLSYRHALGEFRAVRFHVKVDNIFNQTYFENGFQTPGATAVTGMQFEF